MAKRRKILNISQLPDGLAGVDQFTELIDTPNSYVGQAGKSVRVNVAENALEYYTPSEVGASISFLDLIDTPSSYTGQGGRLVRVNAGATALEFDTTTYVPTTRTLTTTDGITGGGDLSANRTIGLTGQALALHNLATSGYIVRTGAGTVAARTFQAGTGISLTNADGISGNTTITLNATLDNLSDVVITTPTANQTIYYNGSQWINGAYTVGTVTQINTTTGITGGTITTTGTIGFDIPWGDARYAMQIEVLSNQSLWSHVALQNGIDFTPYTTGSAGYPSTLGFAVAFYASTSDSTSGYGRAFALNRAYNTENYYLGSPNTSGVHNGWRLIYHSGNLTIGTLGGVSTATTITINGLAQDLSTNRTWSVGTITSIATGTGLTGGTITSTGTLALTGQALAFHNLATNGIVYRNGATIGTRTITGSTYITVTNGDGTAGNPTISLGTFNLDDISDVVLTTPSLGQVLSFNGTNWVNSTITGGGGGTVTSITAGTGLSASPSSPITTTGTLSVLYGTTAGTAAQGNDSRFHDAVTIGTANGLSLVGQALSLALATTSVAGALSAADKTKLDGLSNYTHPTQVAIDTGTLTGADVIARIAVNTLGHTTTVTTRTLTAANLGAEPAFSKGDLVSSTGISFSGTATGRLYGTGSLTITNTDTGSAQNIFKNIANSAGTAQFSAGSNSDTIRFAASGATSVAFDNVTKTVTFSSTDTNTTYTAGTGLDLTSTTFSHTDTSTLSGLYGGSGIASITVDGFGHVTAIATATYLTSLAHTHGIANSAGTQQFTFGVSENVRFAGSGATTVSFDAGTKTVTISSTDNNTVYTHPAYTTRSIDTSGAQVIDVFTSDAIGSVTNITTRTMTLADLGYTGATNADNYGSWLLAASGTAGTASITSGSTVTISAGSNVTVTRSTNTITISATDTNTTYTAGTGLNLAGTVFSLSHLGIQSLTDPNADRIMFWDDSVGSVQWLAWGSGITISGTTVTFDTVFGDGRYYLASNPNGYINSAVTSLAGTSPISVSGSTGAVTVSHANSGVSAGTYNNVTVNATGHVTSGSNASYVTSTATTWYIPRMSSGTAIENSALYENGNRYLGIYHTSPTYEFHMRNVNFNTGVNMELVVEQTNASLFASNNVLAGDASTPRLGASIVAFGNTYPNTVTDGITPRWSGRAGLYINHAIAGSSEANRTFNVWIGPRTIINSLRTGETAIGPNDPTAWLDVQGTLKAKTNFTLEGVGSADTTINLGKGRNGNGYAYIDFHSDATDRDYDLRIIKYPGVSGVFEIRNHSGTMQFINEGANTMVFGNSNAGQMYLNPDGNLLIGTSSATALAGIRGEVIFNTTTAGISCQTTNGYHLMYRRDSTGVLAWYNGTSDIMSLDNSGNLSNVGSITAGTVIKTSAPSGSSAQNWKLGAANFGASSATHEVIVEIAGTVYRLLARV